MKLDRGHWIIASITLALCAYIVFYAPVSAWMGERAQARAQAAQAATEAQEEENVATAGSISTGTILKREGVAVAELWALKKIGAKASEVVHFTSHDSEFRFREFLQGLRERETFQLLGHELPSQSALWIDDFNDGQHRLYTVETPDGETYEFCGWVRRIKTHPPLEGALVFEADVQCTHGPLTREVEEWKYYHCTEAPPAPGTPPPDDPDHWEEVDPPGDFEPGEAAFGNGGVSETWHIVEGYEPHGTEYPFASGDPIGSWIYPYSAWSDTLDGPGAAFAKCLSMFCIYDEDTKVPSKMRAYLKLISGAGTGEAYAVVGLYKVGTPYTRVASSSWLRITNFDAMWVEFDVSDGAVALEEGAKYALIIATSEDAEHEPVSISVSDFEDYTPPDGHQWDPEEEYEYCQTVCYSTTVEESYCP